MKHKFNMPATISYPDPDDPTIVSFDFQLPDGRAACLKLDANDPQISYLIQSNFLFACLFETNGRYELIGLRGTAEDLPSVETENLQLLS